MSSCLTRRWALSVPELHRTVSLAASGSKKRLKIAYFVRNRANFVATLLLVDPSSDLSIALSSPLFTALTPAYQRPIKAFLRAFRVIS